MLETRLKEVITAYRNLSFCDRTAFYYSVSNDVDVSESNLQVFLFKTRLKVGNHGLCVAAQNTRRPSRTDRQGVPCRNR